MPAGIAQPISSENQAIAAAMTHACGARCRKFIPAWQHRFLE
jgi:hypothetical protein